MSKRIPKNAILAIAIGAGCALCGANAFATPELELTSGASNTTIVGSGSSVSYSNTNFDGWDITLVFGNSNSPTLSPFGLDITNLNATCVGSGGCSKDTLTVELSDTGFTTPVGTNGFLNSYSLTGATGSPSTTQTAYFDTTNTILTTPAGGLICSITLTGTSGNSCVGGGPAGPSPYSLTLVDTFAPGTNVSYSSDGNIVTKVPEPASLVLFGAGLLGLSWLVRRKNRA